MDPLTHAVTGATVAAFVAQEEDMRRAAIVGAVAGLIPDLDVLISDANDPLLQLEMHRQFSHSLLVAPVIGGWSLWLPGSCLSPQVLYVYGRSRH